MAKPLNEQTLLERVEGETRSQSAAPSGSAARPQRTGIRTASGVANEATGFVGGGSGPGAA
jgi:hypothetical protein